MDNETIERTITAAGPVASSDIRLAVLDSEVPESIAFCKVLPANWPDYFGVTNGTPSYRRGLPGLAFDRQEHGLVTELYYRLAPSATVSCKKPTDAQRLMLYEDFISGDSGNPFVLIINSQPVLVTCWTGGGAGSGPDYSGLLSAINAKITELSPGEGYSLTTVDLSGFPTYE